MVTWNMQGAKRSDGSYVDMHDFYDTKEDAESACKRLADEASPRFGLAFNIKMEEM